VCDPEEYDFENLDKLPEDCAAFFVMATYGEGEPTDNAVQLMQNFQDESFEFSSGERKLEGLKYVVFGLGNKTYEHYNSIGRAVDASLSKMGATRIGERGEGDDDKSMEEDYLEWKDGMWEAFSVAMNVEEGQGGDSADFVVSELDSHSPEKVYLGKLQTFSLVAYLTLSSKVNFQLARSPRRKVFTMQRILIPHLLPLRESCSSPRMTATVFT
jgi:NADPH-ferrihemoprotein reductase